MKLYLQNCNQVDAEDKSLPVNSYLVTYYEEEGGLPSYDICIGTKVEIFDHYWDRYREGLKDIRWTSGSVPAKVWVSQQEYLKSQQKKKK
ncbi:hypothetical protein SSZBM1_84 [Synechococcus phage S-SZBM1]|uniref:Uncharacterized protein n=1 Tax=Synechococcus phage S-SZBM1 TaxID=2926475 RepID=A0AC61TSI4_9CAUD|nr:hypothetical protein PP650_gp192 [Synechococcus phage S-SZBM1]UNH61201.1 hypothetical protein SSZBM1_84 [Synechococcus phage S-SZBM1]